MLTPRSRTARKHRRLRARTNSLLLTSRHRSPSAMFNRTDTLLGDIPYLGTKPAQREGSVSPMAFKTMNRRSAHTTGGNDGHAKTDDILPHPGPMLFRYRRGRAWKEQIRKREKTSARCRISPQTRSRFLFSPARLYSAQNPTRALSPARAVSHLVSRSTTGASASTRCMPSPARADPAWRVAHPTPCGSSGPCPCSRVR